MKKESDYLTLLTQIPSDREALVMSENHWTYGMLVKEAQKRRMEYGLKEEPGRRLAMIQESGILEQLILFLAYSGTEAVPVIIPSDMRNPKDMMETNVPEKSCMAVMTSGTTGESKLLFRTMESWNEFFPIQNKIFGMGEGTRVFMQGSLAFTGNLNLYLAQLTGGGTIVAADKFEPLSWMEQIEKQKVDVIYLVPVKLRLLNRIYDRKQKWNNIVRTILTGSQSFGGKESQKLKKNFKEASFILYYGASELNYVTYIKDPKENADKSMIGRPFPNVKVRVENGDILVSTRYGVIGMEQESRIGDRGHFDQQGNLYFDGRNDGIVNVNGRKMSSVQIERRLEEVPGIAEAAVKVEKKEGREVLAAWIVPSGKEKPQVSEIRNFVRPYLEDWEIPRIFFYITDFPRSESGKVLKRKLELPFYRR